MADQHTIILPFDPSTLDLIGVTTGSNVGVDLIEGIGEAGHSYPAGAGPPPDGD